jgi:peptide/nickel transport system permease protein
MEALSWTGILARMALQFLPVWIALVLTFAVSIRYRRRLGLYGRLFDSTIGMIGFGVVMFWIFTAIFAGQIATHNPLTQVSGMKNALPGSPCPRPSPATATTSSAATTWPATSSRRMVLGAREVLKIAPAATVFAFMVGITLGLPAGYFGGRLDTFLSFLANLVLAFPVILLFYLLVTPEIRADRHPGDAGGRPLPVSDPVPRRAVEQPLLHPAVEAQPLRRHHARHRALGSTPGSPSTPIPLGIVSMPPNLLNVFVAVVFVNAPTVFRIVRGIVLDIKTRDYVAAGQTRGEGPWYIMLWEILPNARGPLIVDFCLRIGYTTILLGTLGFFGLGVSPESPDWGSTINEGRRLLSLYPHPALVPAFALMSLVLGLNLLADGLREESLRD